MGRTEQQVTISGSPKTFRIGWAVLSSALVLLGLVAFLRGISGPQAQRVWHAYLVNFLFWMGLANGAVLFVAALNMTQARWARPMKRLAEAFGAFLPVGLLLFGVLYFGRNEIFPWIRDPVPEKTDWLNAGFLFARDGVGLLLLSALGVALVSFSVKGDKAFLSKSFQEPMAPRGQYPLSPSAGMNHERISACWHAQVILSPILVIAGGFVLSLVAIDLIMSLDPSWVSTLFGAYYFLGSFYAGLAAVAVLSALSLKTPGLGEFLPPRYFHDLGKLVFAFCLLTGYFFFAQFLTIWYGNLPAETRYVLLRLHRSPWEPLAWTILGAAFILPFVVLLSRRVKMGSVSLMGVSLLILIGMWLERYLLVVPSYWKENHLPIGLPEVFITAGFLGLVALSLILFLRSFPLLPFSDPLFQKLIETEREDIG